MHHTLFIQRSEEKSVREAWVFYRAKSMAELTSYAHKIYGAK
jgi:hypothetical protein